MAWRVYRKPCRLAVALVFAGWMDPVGAADAPRTWHYGVVAQWWAEFGAGGPEIACFRALIDRYGEPALDVACGTGRLLLPYLRDGLDVDGCDISPDMLAWCRSRASQQGLAPRLYRQAMHELDLPRSYRTVYVCGGFGIGGNRGHDQAALRRFRDHLHPGGALVMDTHLPYADVGTWQYWLKDNRRALPEPPPSPRPRAAADGSDLDLSARVLDVDPLAQVITREMRARRWRGGHLEADERHTLKETLYFRYELLMMLHQAGFGPIAVEGGYEHAPPARDTDILVFIAHKSPG
jgi:SAM-dependent methyltransferase